LWIKESADVRFEACPMIDDSIPWKDELLKIADRLESRKTQRRWTERTGFLVERDIMLSAYAVRKLLEARKVSDILAARRVIVRQHSLLGRTPDIWNRSSFWENYDLDTGQDVSMSISDFCNQIIHSWNWSISADERGDFDGVYVSSDRQRSKALYFMDINTLIELFRDVGSEDVAGIEIIANEQGERYISRVLTREQIESEGGAGE
jgi:hypothetical protein